MSLRNMNSGLSHLFLSAARRCWIVSVFLAAASQAASPLRAQDEPTSKELPSSSEHLATMARRAGRLSMKYSGGGKQTAPRLLQNAVLRPANKGGNPDGSVWLWLD